jgi:hypothetical protein
LQPLKPFGESRDLARILSVRLVLRTYEMWRLGFSQTLVADELIILKSSGEHASFVALHRSDGGEAN